MRSLSKAPIAAAVLLLSMALAQAQSQTPVYNLVKDFSIASNPNGVWSYYTRSGAHLHPLEIGTDALYGIPGWTAWIDHRKPPHTTEVARNDTGKVIRYGSIVAPKDELMLNLEANSGTGVIFTVPTHGLYRIDAEFQVIDKHAFSRDVQIYLRSQVLGAILSTFGQTADYHHYVSLKAGQQIYFFVQYAFSKPKPPPRVGAIGLLLNIKGPIIKAQ